MTQVWETVVTPCECCGQVVARRLWVAEVGGDERRFCSQACEELYSTYVLPRTKGQVPVDGRRDRG